MTTPSYPRKRVQSRVLDAVAELARPVPPTIRGGPIELGAALVANRPAEPTQAEIDADLEKMKRLPTMNGMTLVIRRVLAGLRYCVRVEREAGPPQLMIPPELADALLEHPGDHDAACAAFEGYKLMTVPVPNSFLNGATGA